MNDTGGVHAGKRWDGDPNVPGAFARDPEVFAAVQAAGIVNRSNASSNWNLYDNVTRTALLGAVRYERDGLRSGRTRGDPLEPPWPPPVVWGAAMWTPEPASVWLVALVGLAGLRIRRGR